MVVLIRLLTAIVSISVKVTTKDAVVPIKNPLGEVLIMDDCRSEEKTKMAFLTVDFIVGAGSEHFGQVRLPIV